MNSAVNLFCFGFSGNKIKILKNRKGFCFVFSCEADFQNIRREGEEKNHQLIKNTILFFRTCFADFQRRAEVRFIHLTSEIRASPLGVVPPLPDVDDKVDFK